MPQPIAVFGQTDFKKHYLELKKSVFVEKFQVMLFITRIRTFLRLMERCMDTVGLNGK